MQEEWRKGVLIALATIYILATAGTRPLSLADMGPTIIMREITKVSLELFQKNSIPAENFVYRIRGGPTRTEYMTTIELKPLNISFTGKFIDGCPVHGTLKVRRRETSWEGNVCDVKVSS
jgi:hypothetical protein